MRMKLSVLKQLIKEEFLREIKVDTRRAKLVKVGNNWELAVGDYITMSYEASFNMPAGYKLMPAVLPRLFQEGNNIHLLVYYDLDNEIVYESDIDKIKSILDSNRVEYSYDDEENNGDFIISTDQIANWDSFTEK
jgi:hypothetical protein